jgi:hypothetical protein
MNGNPADPGSNRRAFTRIFFDAESVLMQGEHIWSVQLVDISLKGMLVETEEADQINPQAPVLAMTHLGGDVQIRMQMRVAHREDKRLGLQCESVELESLMHLRRLFELNVGDSSLLERELSALEPQR